MPEPRLENAGSTRWKIPALLIQCLIGCPNEMTLQWLDEQGERMLTARRYPFLRVPACFLDRFCS
jgi:hypothetical protein